MQMGREKKAGVAVISNKIDSKTKAIVNNKEGQCIKGTIQQEDITLVKFYALNRGATCKANFDGHKGRDQQKYSHSWGF